MIIKNPIAADIASPDHISDFLLSECREMGDVLTNLKLQKLLYYAQAWYLALEDRAIFHEEFQAWVHGPVLLSQYHRFSHFSWRPIDLNVRRPNAIPRKIMNHLGEIIRVFGTETAIGLEIMTHQEMPWKTARRGLSPDRPSNVVISKASMKDFYKHV